MKNNKGITLISLVVYMAIIFIVTATIIRITTHFKSNMEDAADISFETEFSKLNLYLLDEVKRSDSGIQEIVDGIEIVFFSGNKYTYDPEEKTIYLNGNIKICENVDNCLFEQKTAENGKYILTLTISVEGIEKTTNYVISSMYTIGNIPEQYQQVEYIESTGTQYIDTGINMASNIQLVLDFQLLTSENSGERILTGSWDNRARGFIFAIRNGVFQYIYGNDSWNGTTAVADSQRHTITVNKEGKAFFDEQELASQGSNTLNSNTSIYLFNTNVLRAWNTGIKAKIYSVQIYQNGTLIRDFIPCYRKADEMVGMYDQVNGQFYTNIGTGEFIKGKNIIEKKENQEYINEEDYIYGKLDEEIGVKLPAEYQQVEYIESTGTQYIDTGVNGGTAMAFNIKLNTLGKKAIAYEQYFAGDLYPDGVKIYAENSTAVASSKGGTGKYVNLTHDNNIHEIIYKTDGNLIIDGVSKGVLGGGGWGNLTYYVFNSHGEPNLMSSMRLYQLKMYTDGTIVRDFIPCYRKSDNVIGLYDLVNDVFYTNAGTGSFVAGANIE